MENKLIRQILNIMFKMDFEPEELSYNDTQLKEVLHIKDLKLRSQSILYYRKYYDVAKEMGGFKDLRDMNVDFDPDDIDDEIMVLAQFLDIHPLLIEDTGYGAYRDILDDDEYRVLNSSDAEDEFRERAEEYINEQSSFSDIGWLENYLEMNDYGVEQYASDEADYRVDDLGAEDVIREMDAEDDLEELLSAARNKEERYNELDNDIVDFQDKIEEITSALQELNEEMDDLESEASESNDQDEIDDLKSEYNIKKEEFIKLNNDLEYLEQQLEVSQSEFDNLDDESFDEDRIKEDFADDLRDDLREKIATQIFDDIEGQGIGYFTGNFGYTSKQVIEYGYFEINMDDAIESLESDRGNMMSSYDGIENEEEYNGETWYIYRTN